MAAWIIYNETEYRKMKKQLSGDGRLFPTVICRCAEEYESCGNGVQGAGVSFPVYERFARGGAEEP